MSEKLDERRKQKHLQDDREASGCLYSQCDFVYKPKQAIEKQLKLMQNSANLRA